MGKKARERARARESESVTVPQVVSKSVVCPFDFILHVAHPSMKKHNRKWGVVLPLWTIYVRKHMKSNAKIANNVS